MKIEDIKIGMKVRIKMANDINLINGKGANGIIFLSSKKRYLGKEYIVERLRTKYVVLRRGGGWKWDPDWLDPIEEIIIDSKINIFNAFN